MTNPPTKTASPKLTNDQILGALTSELSYACSPTDNSTLSQSQRLNLRLNELSQSNPILKGFVVKRMTTIMSASKMRNQRKL